MERSPIIRFERLSKVFDGFTALDSIDFDIPQGSIYGIIGASGAGKSTLLRTINGLERPTEGRVEVLGKEPAKLSRGELSELRRSVSMVFQHHNLLKSKTVAENVAMPLVLAGEKNAASGERVREVLEMVGLSDRATHYPSELSGGQRQRAGIARALVTSPKVVLCDEPTSALDPVTTGQILDLISRINRELGITVVIITHQMHVIARLADLVSVLDAGKVVESGPVSEIFMRPRTPEARELVGSASRGGGTGNPEDPACPHQLSVTTIRPPQEIISEVARLSGENPVLVRADSLPLRNATLHNLTLATTSPCVPASLNDARTTAEVYHQ
ncbi:methionine ABC transporter ATP-binding protein [Corynebacterium liangguodongii]|uniref:ABC transporter n=1 Tax=Corynebacterium liangguodongii TaxID=2079535 RepID=A0A2S0WBJ5_9CORY|nr:ATP-binding cassette domain-containing protein [Corynebacterium liangguodongii]AWB83124.1 ABC transporter [Corynebacterium liangguodongii]PWB99275.1 ABC transporter [Corynebacterium liangguodongii]